MNEKKIIQISLFLLAVLVTISSLYFYKIENFRKNKTFDKIKNKNNLVLSEDKLNLIKDISYFSKDASGNQFQINSSSGSTNIDNTNIINMELVIAKIIFLNSGTIYITSDKAKYNNQTYETNFYENVKVIYLEHQITSDNLHLFLQNNTISMTNNVVYKSPNSSIEADIIEIDILVKKLNIFMNDKSKKVKALYNN
jgi:lipopolysaccharide export system protein LptA